MNWKKVIKYTGAILIILSILSFFWAGREGKRMYGGLTKIVDHTAFSPETGSFAIKNVNVLSADGQHFIAGQTVILEKGLIAEIDSAFNLSPEMNIIDGTDKFLIPGLIDAHVHLFQSPNDLLLYLANGVTEIRELIGEENHLNWRQEIKEGRIGPKMFVASPRLGSFGYMEGKFMVWSQGFLNIRNAKEARETVNRLFEEGYDGLKIYSYLNKESYLAVTRTADSLGMPVFGHIPFALEFSDIWKNGQSGIAHFEELMNALQREFGKYKGDEIERLFGSFKGQEDPFLSFVEQRSDELAENLMKHDISVTSTLWLTQSFVRQKVELDKVLKEIELAYENPGISEGSVMTSRAIGWLPPVNRYRFSENLTDEQKAGNRVYWETYGKACQILAKNLAAKGVKIMAGTDANLPPTVPGFSLHDELQSLQEAGMSEAQVLQAATSNPAQWLKSNAGKVLPGYDANLVLLDKNPLEDIANTKAIHTVIAKGRVFGRALLDQILAAVRKANDESRTVDIQEYE